MNIFARIEKKWFLTLSLLSLIATPSLACGLSSLKREKPEREDILIFLEQPISVAELRWLVVGYLDLVPRNKHPAHPKITALYKKALKGHAKSQRELAWSYCYWNSAKIERDDALAFYWYEKATFAQDEESQHNLGVFFLLGLGTRCDPSQSYHLLISSSWGISRCWLARLFMEGIAINQSYETARKILEEDVDQKNGLTKINLGVIFMREGGDNNYAKAKKLFSDARHAYSKYYLGILYENGWGTDKSVAMAAQLYTRSEHIWLCSLALSSFYLFGEDHEVPKSQGFAQAYMNSAIENGPLTSNNLVLILDMFERPNLARNKEFMDFALASLAQYEKRKLVVKGR